VADVVLTGGCQCGAVRFRAGRVGKSAICHCRMCQKAFGSYFGPLVVAHDVAWTRGGPKFFRSSNMVQRGFCADCGTPLCFLDDDGALELAGGAFDDPSAVAPTVQYNLRHRVPFFASLPTLTRQPREDLESAANSKVVDYQHPDHDTVAWPPHRSPS
jgi:hypothetical protein